MEKKTEQMNEELEAADTRLYNAINQMKVANTIRAMIENGAVADDIYEYVKSIVKVGLEVKEASLREIALSHLELSERHQNLTDKSKLV